MSSFGEKLKLEREKRKITLEQISSSTKIGTRMLQALEEDHFEQLPGGIFNKGFVRAYSRCLGLDEDQTVAEYLEASGDAPTPRRDLASQEEDGRHKEEQLRRLEGSEDYPPRRMPWGWFAAILLIVAIALSLWTRHQRERVKQPVVVAPISAAMPVATPVPSAQSLPETSGSAAAGGAASAKPVQVVNSNVADASAANAANPQPAGQTSGSGRLQPASPLAIAGSPASPTKDSAAPSASPGEFTVVVRAREDCWISIAADGNVVSSRLLTAGMERTVHGEKEVVVKAGNAGALDFFFNGNKVDAGAKYGEVRTVTFGPGGMIATPPAPPSTP